MANPITTAAFNWATMVDRGLAEAERAELAAWLADQQAEDKAETMLQELSAYGLTA